MSGTETNSAGTCRQRLLQRPQGGAGDAPYCLAPHDVLNLFLYKIQDHQPKTGTNHNGLVSPQLINNLENVL